MRTDDVCVVYSEGLVWRPSTFIYHLDRDTIEMDTINMVAALLDGRLPISSLENIQQMVLWSAISLSILGYFLSDKLRRLRLIYVLRGISMTLFAIFFIITTLLEGIYFTLLLLGVAIFFVGFFQTLVLSPPLATQKRLYRGVLSSW
jgi:hypothetical protein